MRAVPVVLISYKDDIPGVPTVYVCAWAVLYNGIGQSGISSALSNKSFCFSTTSGSSCGISPIPPVIVDQEPIDTTDLGPVIGVDNIAGLDSGFSTD